MFNSYASCSARFLIQCIVKKQFGLVNLQVKAEKWLASGTQLMLVIRYRYPFAENWIFKEGN